MMLLKFINLVSIVLSSEKLIDSEYWINATRDLDWFVKPKKTLEFDTKLYKARWFYDGKINLSYNCIDRHLSSKGDKIAIIFQGENEDSVKKITYKELYRDVCNFAKVLKKNGVKKGDRVVIYMPNIPEAVVAMLASVRIGAVHNVIFSGFGSEALMKRIVNSRPKIILTSSYSTRGGKTIPLKNYLDNAIDMIKDKTISKDINVIVLKYHKKDGFSMKPGRDFDWDKSIEECKNLEDVPVEQLNSEDPSFIIYTSGTTGEPKGLVHTIGGYATQVNKTFKEMFSPNQDDIFWCTADIGWITGHSYLVYAPLMMGITTVLFDGIPTYPKPDRFWKIIDKFKVNIFYTAPTAIRSLQKFGNNIPNKYNLSSLRVLGSVGEPINKEAWKWYFEVIGKEKCPIIDTWWQTETGGVMISPRYSEEIKKIKTKKAGSEKSETKIDEIIKNEVSKNEIIKNEKDEIKGNATEEFAKNSFIDRIKDFFNNFSKYFFKFFSKDSNKNLESSYFDSLKPCSVTKPLCDFKIDVVNEEGNGVNALKAGFLVIDAPWPAMARTIYRNHDRYIKTYWEKFPGKYFSGDGAYKDQDGNYYITGRIDDEVKVSGHRLGTFEIENVIASCKGVVESAIVPIKHDIKGNALCAFVVVKKNHDNKEDEKKMKKKILDSISSKISPIAKPDYICFVKELPKTRSGKIMRRVLKAIANNPDINDKDLGDISTITNSESIKDIKVKIKSEKDSKAKMR